MRRIRTLLKIAAALVADDLSGVAAMIESARILLDADTCLTEAELDEELMLNSRVFHFSTLSRTDDPARTATWQAIDLVKEKGIPVSLDPTCASPCGAARRTPRRPSSGASGRRTS